jgi:uncharacterized alkaline shock family protein YloU
MTTDDLRKKARQNVEATFTDKDRHTETKKKGVHPSNNDKQTAKHQSFGLSKGVTLNMGDFESLRVDVWLSDEVQKGETVSEAFDRVNEILQEELERMVKDTQENM